MHLRSRENKSETVIEENNSTPRTNLKRNVPDSVGISGAEQSHTSLVAYGKEYIERCIDPKVNPSPLYLRDISLEGLAKHDFPEPSIECIVDWSCEEIRDGIMMPKFDVDNNAIIIEILPDQDACEALVAKVSKMKPNERYRSIKCMPFDQPNRKLFLHPTTLANWLSLNQKLSEPYSACYTQWFWLEEHTRTDDPIRKFFAHTPIDTPLNNFDCVGPRVRSLLRFFDREWLDDGCMSLGMDVLRKIAIENGKDKTVCILHIFFWQLLDFRAKDPRRPRKDKVVGDDEMNQLRCTVEAKGILLIPFTHNTHWMVAIIDFGRRQFLLAEGKNYSCPTNFRQLVFRFMKEHTNDDMAGFPPMARSNCPRQEDADSCGVIALSVMQTFCVTRKQDEDRWTQARCNEYRLLWLRRILAQHDPTLYSGWSGYQEHQRDLGGSQTEVARSPFGENFGQSVRNADFNTSAPSNIISIEVTPPPDLLNTLGEPAKEPLLSDCDYASEVENCNQSGSEANAHEEPEPDEEPSPLPGQTSYFTEVHDLHTHGFNYPPPLPLGTNGKNLRKRRQDPLPYEMESMEGPDVEKPCDFCGPPFKQFNEILDLVNQQPCTMACAKRYLVEVYAKPYGCNLTHRQSEAESHGRDTPYQKLILRCEFGRKPQVKHKNNIVPELYRSSASKRNECPFGATITYPLNPQSPFHIDRPVFSTIHPKHNHDVWPNAQRNARQVLSTSEIRLLEELAVEKTSAKVEYFIDMLKGTRKDVVFDKRQIHNIVTQARADAKKNINDAGDLSTLFNRLQQSEEEDKRWFSCSTMKNGTLDRLLWMNPFQQLLLKNHGYVIILDTSAGKNEYDYSLTTFTLIDYDCRTRNFAFCIHASQDAESFSWMFRNIKARMATWTHSATVESIFSDRAGGITLALELTWKEAFHGLCLHHVYDNLKKNLRSKLGDAFETFISDFWNVYYSGSQLNFESNWIRLLNTYAGAREYLTKYMYPVRRQWAWIWVSSHFTAGTRTTGRVESEHSIYKSQGIRRGDNFNQLFDKLMTRVKGQTDSDYMKRWKASRVEASNRRPKIGWETQADHILEEGRQILTPGGYKRFYDEVHKSMYMDNVKKIKPGAQPLVAPSSESGEFGQAVSPIWDDSKIWETLDAERRDIAYEYFLRSISANDLIGSKLYMVKPEDTWTQGGKCRRHRPRFVAILRSGVRCTCCLETYWGMLCCHFFAVLRKADPVEAVSFTMSQIHTQWHNPEIRLDPINGFVNRPISWIPKSGNKDGAPPPTGNKNQATPTVVPAASTGAPQPPMGYPSNITPVPISKPNPNPTPEYKRKRDSESTNQLSPSKRLRALQATVHAKISRFTDLGPSQKSLDLINKILTGEIENLEDRRRIASGQDLSVGDELRSYIDEPESSLPSTPLTHGFRDPPRKSGPGAKQKKRLAGSHETGKRK